MCSSMRRGLGPGRALTAWELAQAGVPHTLIADHASGHYMRKGRIQRVIVGADRVTANGDVGKQGRNLQSCCRRA